MTTPQESSPNPTSPKSRKGKGRKKLPMEKIRNESNLQVTFSKRRAGIFNKGNELCTLTGAQAAAVIFSPSGKAHSFGAPDVQSVVEKYHSLVSGGEANSPLPRVQSSEPHREETRLKLVEEWEKKRSVAGKRAGEPNKTRKNFPASPIQQLKQLLSAMETVRGNADADIQKIMNPMTSNSGMAGGSLTPAPAPAPTPAPALEDNGYASHLF